jgi:hypothetical protein
VSKLLDCVWPDGPAHEGTEPGSGRDGRQAQMALIARHARAIDPDPVRGLGSQPTNGSSIPRAIDPSEAQRAKRPGRKFLDPRHGMAA